MKITKYALAFLLISLLGCATSQKSQINRDPINIGMLTTNEDQKQVNVIYYENSLSVPNAEITLDYYDEVLSKHIVQQLKSDSKGILSSLIPCNPDGSSSIFTIVLSKTGIPNDKIGIRIPPEDLFGGGKKYITLRLDNTLVVYNEGSEMQLMNFPKDGLKVDMVDSTTMHIIYYDFVEGTSSGGHQMGMVNGQIKPVGVGDIFMEGSSFDLRWK
jgi:hypothetical protein